MKKAVVTVAAGHSLANAGALVRSVKRFYPEYDAIVCLLDGVAPSEKDGCRFIPASSFFVEGAFKRRAFMHTEEVLRQVVAVKALAHLLPGYDALLLCSPFGRFRAQIPDLAGQGPGSVTYLVDGRAQTAPRLGTGFLLNDFPFYRAPALQLAAGQKTTEFLAFCDEKMDYLASIGIGCAEPLGFEGYPVEKHAEFYTTWYNYAEACGCGTRFLRLENLSLKQGAGLDALPFVDFAPLAGAGEEKIATFPGKVRGQYAAYQAALDPADADDETTTRGYTFDAFEDGTPINALLRTYYCFDYRLRDNAGPDPFARRDLFFNQNVVAGDTGLLLHNAPMRAVWRSRDDLRRVYPEPLGVSRLAYARWFLQHAGEDNALPAAYMEDLADSLAGHNSRQATAAAARPALQKAKNRVRRLLGKPVHIPVPEYAAPSLAPGVNLCGYIRGDFGVGEACRILAASLEAAGVPFTVVDFMPPIDYTHTFTNHSWDHKITNQFRYNTNILLTNAPGTRLFLESVAPTALNGRYNIGYWYWELPEFPNAWKPYIEPLDELWTSSEFTAEAFRSATQKPVTVVPCCVELGASAPLARADFGLDNAAFVFLMMYDAQSYNERKNPTGALRAFLSKFEGRPEVQLAIKVSAPPGWSYNDAFMREAEAHANVVLLKGTYPREKVNALLHCCDAFVSLHRSEGFGLGPAEAMYLGKPAVLTNWSGNTQYMTPDNCCPVDCKIIEIPENQGTSEYKQGMHWAEPDIAQAAGYMQRLVEDPAYYQAVARAGQQTILTHYNAGAVGGKARARLEVLDKL